MSRTSVPGEGWSVSDDASGWSATTQHHGGHTQADSDEGWSSARPVYARRGAATRDTTRNDRRGSQHERSTPPPRARAVNTRVAPTVPPARTPEVEWGEPSWNSAGPLPARDQRAVRNAERRAARSQERRSGAQAQPEVARAPERGLQWWAALGVLIVIAALGGLIDGLASISGKGAFNVGVVIASVVAIVVVKRSHMFPIVIAPPIVYSVAAILQLYVQSNGLDDRKVVLDAAANYLVYGFPAIAAATAAVLIIAGIRLISRK